MGAIEKLIPPGSRLLLQEAMNPDLARQDIEKMLLEAAQEEKRQKTAKIEKGKAVARGEDPADVRLEEQNVPRQAPVDEDIARLGL